MSLPPDFRVTQKDIAERAGVTQMTVSLALRGAAKLSPETVKRIRALADEMGYVPNPLVSSLIRTRRGRGKVETGLAIAWHGAYSALPKNERGRPDRCDTYAEMLEGAREACRRNGVELKLFKYLETGVELPRVLKARGIHGLVLGPIGPNKSRGIPLDQLEGVHLLRVAPGAREKGLDMVERNFFDEMRMCTTELVRAGCRKIGYIDYHGHEADTGHRWKGAFYASETQDVKICRPYIPRMKGTVPLNRLIEYASKRLEEYIQEEHPDGLVVGGRIFIQAVINRVKTAEPFPFVCLERNAWPDWISGVESNFHQIGADAAQLLINRILSPYSLDTANRTTAVHSAWHEGTSHLIPQ